MGSEEIILELSDDSEGQRMVLKAEGRTIMKLVFKMGLLLVTIPAVVLCLIINTCAGLPWNEPLIYILKLAVLGPFLILGVGTVVLWLEPFFRLRWCICRDRLRFRGRQIGSIAWSRISDWELRSETAAPGRHWLTVCIRHPAWRHGKRGTRHSILLSPSADLSKVEDVLSALGLPPRSSAARWI